jgi:hypothetical protein
VKLRGNFFRVRVVRGNKLKITGRRDTPVDIWKTVVKNTVLMAPDSGRGEIYE